MSSKQIKARLEKLTTKIKGRRAELSTLQQQAKTLRTDLATARATEKSRQAATTRK